MFTVFGSAVSPYRCLTSIAVGGQGAKKPRSPPRLTPSGRQAPTGAVPRAQLGSWAINKDRHMNQSTAPEATPEEQEALLEQARNEAQARVADVHTEEGTVASEKAQNSPHPDDHD